MGNDTSPTKVDRNGPKSKSVIGRGAGDAILPSFDAVGLKGNLLNRSNYTALNSTTVGLDREKNIATYG